MSDAITLSLFLQLKDINPNTIYQLVISGLENERINLQVFEASLDVAGYTNSLFKIRQYQRILSILRTDTLNALGAATSGQQPVN